VLTGRFDELTGENAMREEQMGNLKTQLASLETEKDVKVSEQGTTASRTTPGHLLLGTYS